MTQSNYCKQIEAALESDEPVPREDYLRWVQDGDLSSQARAYELSASAWGRIEPEPSMEEQCSFMARYFLSCIEHHLQSDEYVLNGFEGGRALAAWLKHLQRVAGTESVVKDVARDMGELYKRLDEEGRNRLETGALEHILETPALRAYFNFWQDDSTLRVALESALAWGLAHTEQAG